MNDTYTRLADICALFYDLYNDSNAITDFVSDKLMPYPIRKICFVGGFFSVAGKLAEAGLDITVVDYTDEMVEEARKRLPGTQVVKADLRALPFNGEFDAVVVIGRVFTHMLTDEDFQRAIESCVRALRPGGLLLFDNYEDSKIGKTPYFNKTVRVAGKNSLRMERTSSTEAVSSKPFIVKWKAAYQLYQSGHVSEYQDEMLHRAFSREEIRELLRSSPFEVLAQGDNFDETSFYTLARKLK